MTGIFTADGGYLPATDRTCVRCRHVLVGEDEAGPYYQIPVEQNMGPLYPGGPDTILTFADRVHQCDGKPHTMTWCNATPAGANWPVCALPEGHRDGDPEIPHESADFWWLEGEQNATFKRDEGA